MDFCDVLDTIISRIFFWNYIWLPSHPNEIYVFKPKKYGYWTLHTSLSYEMPAEKMKKFYWVNGFSKHRPSGPMVSISRNVRMFVCVFVCHTFSLRLTVFLPPLPEVQCPNFLYIRNPWGKVMERSGLRFENFCS